jgi:hypothetical protein
MQPAFATARDEFRGYRSGRIGNPLQRAEAWLDGHGRKAWIAAMVAGFVLFWPVGLALVLFMTATGKWSMGLGERGSRGMRGFGTMGRGFGSISRSTGNAAFDAYKADTLRRMEDEQRAFEEFLERLREAKDKAEFDQFMDERTKRTAPGTDEA